MSTRMRFIPPAAKGKRAKSDTRLAFCRMVAAGATERKGTSEDLRQRKTSKRRNLQITNCELQNTRRLFRSYNS